MWCWAFWVEALCDVPPLDSIPPWLCVCVCVLAHLLLPPSLRLLLPLLLLLLRRVWQRAPASILPPTGIHRAKKVKKKNYTLDRSNSGAAAAGPEIFSLLASVCVCVFYWWRLYQKLFFWHTKDYRPAYRERKQQTQQQPNDPVLFFYFFSYMAYTHTHAHTQERRRRRSYCYAAVRMTSFSFEFDFFREVFTRALLNSIFLKNHNFAPFAFLNILIRSGRRY